MKTPCTFHRIYLIPVIIALLILLLSCEKETIKPDTTTIDGKYKGTITFAWENKTTSTGLCSREVVSIDNDNILLVWFVQPSTVGQAQLIGKSYYYRSDVKAASTGGDCGMVVTEFSGAGVFQNDSIVESGTGIQITEKGHIKFSWTAKMGRVL